MKSYTNAWQFKPISSSEYLRSLKEDNATQYHDAPFTNLRFSLRNQYEISEFVEATDEKNINQLITQPLLRLALFETVIYLSTEVQLRDERDLADLVRRIYKDHLRPALKSTHDILAKQEKLLAIARNISFAIVNKEASEKNNSQYYQLFDNNYKKILQRIANGQYQLHTYLNITDDNGNRIEDTHAAITELTRRYIQDMIYRKKSIAFMSELIAQMIGDVINKNMINYEVRDSADDSLSGNTLKKLSTHPGVNRHTFMLLGAPASGKGTYNSMFSAYARDTLAIDWADTLKVNTDTYRQFLSQPANDNNSLEDIKYSSAFNHDEARHILNRIYECINKKVGNNDAPHLFIDSVLPAVDKLEIGTKDSSSLHIVVLTTPADVAINRAYLRGLKTGRFVSAASILEAHKAVSDNFFKNISTCKDKNVVFLICDTNVNQGASPHVIAKGDMTTNRFFILDRKKIGFFYGKKHINIQAEDYDQIYAENIPLIDHSYKKILKSNEINLVNVKLNKSVCSIDNESLFSLGTPKAKKRVPLLIDSPDAARRQISFFGNTSASQPVQPLISPNVSRKPFTVLEIDSPDMSKRPVDQRPDMSV